MIETPYVKVKTAKSPKRLSTSMPQKKKRENRTRCNALSDNGKIVEEIVEIRLKGSPIRVPRERSLLHGRGTRAAILYCNLNDSVP
jgi:hypothetical protein